jgi:hypothetical protein
MGSCVCMCVCMQLKISISNLHSLLLSFMNVSCQLVFSQFAFKTLPIYRNLLYYNITIFLMQPVRQHKCIKI